MVAGGGQPAGTPSSGPGERSGREAEEASAHIVTHRGVTVEDPYAWLRNLPTGYQSGRPPLSKPAATRRAIGITGRWVAWLTVKD